MLGSYLRLLDPFVPRSGDVGGPRSREGEGEDERGGPWEGCTVGEWLTVVCKNQQQKQHPALCHIFSRNIFAKEQQTIPAPSTASTGNG